MCTRILIADGNRQTREYLKHLFLTSGFEVVCEAANGIAAIQFALVHDFDVAVMDLHLEYLSGIEVMMNLKFSKPQARFLFHSGTDDIELAEQARLKGAHGYIRNDRDCWRLIEAVKTISDGMEYWPQEKLVRQGEQYYA